MKRTRTRVCRKKLRRLNIAITLIMMVFFAGSAFAYITGQTIEFDGLVSFDDGSQLTVVGYRVENPLDLSFVSPVDGQGDFLNVPVADGLVAIPFGVDFTAPGQSIVLYFEIENRQSNNIVLRGLHRDNSSLPAWLQVEGGVYTPAGNAVALNNGVVSAGSAVDFRVEVSVPANLTAGNTWYISDTHTFGLAVNFENQVPGPTGPPGGPTDPPGGPTGPPPSIPTDPDDDDDDDNGNGNGGDTILPTPPAGAAPAPEAGNGTDDDADEPPAPQQAVGAPDATADYATYDEQDTYTDDEQEPSLPQQAVGAPDTTDVDDEPGLPQQAGGNPLTGDNQTPIWLIFSSVGFGLSVGALVVGFFRKRRLG